MVALPATRQQLLSTGARRGSAAAAAGRRGAAVGAAVAAPPATPPQQQQRRRRRRPPVEQREEREAPGLPADWLQPLLLDEAADGAASSSAARAPGRLVNSVHRSPHLAKLNIRRMGAPSAAAASTSRQPGAGRGPRVLNPARRAALRSQRRQARRAQAMAAEQRSGGGGSGDELLQQVAALRSALITRDRSTMLSRDAQCLCCTVIKAAAKQDLSERPEVATAVCLAEAALLEDNENSMYTLARKLSLGSGVPFEDLCTSAIAYLHRAAVNFNVDSKTAFRTYFYTCMRSQMLTTIAEQKCILKVPERVTKTAKVLDDAQRSLLEALGREPTLEELAEACSLPVAKVAGTRKHMLLTSSPFSYEDLAPEDNRLYDDLHVSWLQGAGEDELFLRVAGTEVRGAMEQLMAQLTEPERELLTALHGLGPDGTVLSNYALGKQLGCARTTVASRAARAMAKLRAQLPALLQELLLSDAPDDCITFV